MSERRGGMEQDKRRLEEMRMQRAQSGKYGQEISAGDHAAAYGMPRQEMGQEMQQMMPEQGGMGQMMGGMGGYTASFDKLVSFNIYRNITLVGGYTKYTKTYSKPDDAYWRYICELEDITREIVPYSTRIRLLIKMRELNEFTDNDNELNIFLLVDGKINSVWRKGTEYETSKE